MKKFYFAGRPVCAAVPAGARDAVWLCAEPEDAEAVLERLPDAPFALFSVGGADWNRDYSPWPAPRAFHGGTDFAGGGPAFLSQLTGAIVPQAEAACGLVPERRALAGYSLAGLFAVWALTGTALFSRAASVSGSMWYDGFSGYLAEASLPGAPDFVYFSLGTREAESRSPRLSLVEARTEQCAALLASRGVRTVFEHNPGGHFDDPNGRLARGISALF